jgi:hypothetical protein
VTFLEDLHWFDGASEGFLEPIVEALPGTQGLVLVNFRPGYHAAWSAARRRTSSSAQKASAKSFIERWRSRSGSETASGGLYVDWHGQGKAKLIGTKEAAEA